MHSCAYYKVRSNHTFGLAFSENVHPRLFPNPKVELQFSICLIEAMPLVSVMNRVPTSCREPK